MLKTVLTLNSCKTHVQHDNCFKLLAVINTLEWINEASVSANLELMAINLRCILSAVNGFYKIQI